MSEYAKRAVMEIMAHYAKHVQAMTAEGLHEKSDIAAELAWRDAQLESFNAQLAELRDLNMKSTTGADAAHVRLLAEVNMQRLRITGAKDPMMWYADLIGELVPYCGRWPEAYKSREPAGYLNRVEFADAEIVTLHPDGRVEPNTP